MRHVEMIKLASKLGVVVLLIGLGISLSGMIGFLIEEAAANKATMIGGLVMGAVGYIMVAMQNVLMEDF